MLNETNELIRGLCRQRRQAQERLLQLYGDIVFGLVSRIVPRQEDAEEVYQDVFLKVFQHISSYDAEKASLDTWISRIAYHESLNLVRRIAPQSSMLMTATFVSKTSLMKLSRRYWNDKTKELSSCWSVPLKT